LQTGCQYPGRRLIGQKDAGTVYERADHPVIKLRAGEAPPASAESDSEHLPVSSAFLSRRD
jgi:hypothetical protein